MQEISGLRELTKANLLLKKGEYVSALQIYLHLRSMYQFKSLDYNINLCNKKILNKSNKTYEEYDAVTQILLANMGHLSISTDHRKKLIETINNKILKNKSQDAIIKEVNPIPKEWPKNVDLFPLPDGPNDFLWWSKYQEKNKELTNKKINLSVIIPTFNRSRILSVTLAALVNQVTNATFEVIVADDGSQEEVSKIVRLYEKYLDIKYVRQKDYGYQLCAVRNLGIRTARNDYIAILDCDMAPLPGWLEAYSKELILNDDCALIGPRKYVDTSLHNPESYLLNPNLLETLPEIKSTNNVSAKLDGQVTKDWRLSHFSNTENLRLCDSPFRYFSGGNVAFAKKWIDKIGYFDEEFTHWGGEDNEFGYRLFRAGCFFKHVPEAMAFHQEPPGKENETDRDAGRKITIEIVKEKVPYFYRKLEPIESSKIFKKPLVSIYIPAFNCKNSIERAVESALAQSISDLEVCIADDGSTDGTSELLHKLYANNPRVRIAHQINKGIGAASNLALSICNGFYIGQLDSDDYLELDAVELCIKEFLKDRTLACVYTTNRNVDNGGKEIAEGYNWPVYSREKLSTAMIIHHFRMFTLRAWSLTNGFNENISNAVDFDMYLKLSEVGNFKHLNKIAYNRVLHGENTSIRKATQQKENHFKVLNHYYARQGKSFIASALSDDIESRAIKLTNFEYKN